MRDEELEFKKRFVTIAEFAKIVSIGHAFIRRLVHVKGFPSIFIGRKVIIPLDAGCKWIEDNSELLRTI